MSDIRDIWQTIKDWCWFTFIIRRDEFSKNVKNFSDRKRAHRCDERWG